MLTDRLSMFWGQPEDCIQVVAKARDKERMESIGWVDHPDKLAHLDNPEPTKVEEPEVAMGDDELSLAVMDANDKDAVEALLKIHRRIDIDKRGKLETVKEKALAVINGNG